MTLQRKLKETLQIDSEVFELDEFEMQKQIAKKLRAGAIHHLRTSQGPVAKAFRGEYAYIDESKPSYESFLQSQSREGVWGTYIELVAIGEALGMNVVVTAITTEKADPLMSNEQKRSPAPKEKKSNPICLYRAESSDAPTLTLYNRNNNHWFVNENTLADNNCLYNAIGQALQPLIKNRAFFDRPDHETIIKYQKAIADAISVHPTPAQLDAQLEVEKARYATLSKIEQTQIHNDYLYALQLAAEEMNRPEPYTRRLG